MSSCRASLRQLPIRHKYPRPETRNRADTMTVLVICRAGQGPRYEEAFCRFTSSHHIHTVVVLFPLRLYNYFISYNEAFNNIHICATSRMRPCGICSYNILCKRGSISRWLWTRGFPSSGVNERLVRIIHVDSYKSEGRSTTSFGLFSILQYWS